MKDQIIYGRNIVLEELEKKRVHKIFLQKGKQDGSLRKIIGKAKAQGIIIQNVNKEKLDSFSEGGNHQGVCAYVSDFSYSTFEEVFNHLEKREEEPFFVLLDGIEDPHNLGAIIRSAHQAGANGVILPKRRSAQVTSTVYKTSAGAVSHIPIIQVTNLSQTVMKLKEKGLWIFGTDMGGDPYYRTNLTGPLGIVIGNEGKGIGKGLKKHLDGILSIPMVGQLDSLNASCAASIVFFEVLKQKHEKTKTLL
ncbi:MAG: 23S rRNA (guanosine(2251)-2'-O)-methyltransferase RlmB [Tissierellia bacterium]|nr:23S rRNA (guanosine(2251)-2'-O)-methyltransferase RlmB [Tissierellia bacterium]